MKTRAMILCGFILALGGFGCAPRPALGPPPASQAPPPSSGRHPDQEMLVEGLRRGSLSPVEVANLSDRLLAEGSPTLQDEQTMARLDILLTKTLKEPDKEGRHRLLRNLGILHYHQKKFNLSRQALQQANELFPRDARTHYYLARLAMHQGMILQRKGLKKKAKGQFKLAANEMELARKFEPSNPLFRQDLKNIIQQEGATSPPESKK